MNENIDFFTNLESFTDVDQISKSSYYKPAPTDWILIITDVISSTKAIEKGRYKEVNIVGVSSIIAVKNALSDFDFPYIFGGDGATLLIPTSFLPQAKKALSFTRQTALEQFDLGLRIGIIPVQEIYQKNLKIEVAKMKLSENNFIAMMQGDGLVQAEAWIKKDQNYLLPADEVAEGQHLGLECRWNPIQSSYGEIMTMIIQKKETQTSTEVFYRDLIQQFKTIVPQFRLVSSEKVPRTWPPKYLMQEMQMKYRNLVLRLFHYYFILGLTWIFSAFIKKAKKEDGSGVSKYIEQLAANTDFLKFDETLKMVIDVTLKQKQQILDLLEENQKKGFINFGVHFSSEAMMTCFIRSLNNHVHFIDGGSGGYTLAAKNLKNKAQINSI